jgi:hypothetical protein
MHQERGTEEPEPGNAQHAVQHDAILVEEFQVPDGFAENVPVDLQFRRGRFGAWHPPAVQIARRGDRQAGRAHPVGPADLDAGQLRSGDGAGQDGHESAHFNQGVAADQFFLAQDLRQDAVLDGAENGRL